MKSKATKRLENLFMAAVIGAAVAVCIAPFVDAEIPSRAVSPDAFVRTTPELEPELEPAAPFCAPVFAEAACDPEPEVSNRAGAAAGTRLVRTPAAAHL